MSVSISVERLRVWLLAGAGLLVLVVAVFLGYAHYRAHRFLAQLPGKLGIDVRQTTDNWTYSQSVGANTLYTIHAAKAIQHNDGKYTLRDVGIVVYGKKQDRADRIYGSEFEYDPAAQLIRAMGEVFIDLQAPEPASAGAKMDYAEGKDLHGTAVSEAAKAGGKEAGGKETGGKEARVIHVKTSGLVYMQKLGVAATEKEIEFTSGGLVGHAVGADYSSDTGIVNLHSAVKVNGLEHERPVVLTASRAELDRGKQTAVLSQARYVVVGGGGKGVGETAQAQHVVVYLRKDGSAEWLQAEGNVTLTNGDGGTVTAPKGEMKLNAENHPESATLLGGVKYAEDGALRKAQGASGEGRAVFDKAGRVEHVVMTGAVHLQERVRATEAAAWSERELNAGSAELALFTDAAGKVGLRDTKAVDDARLKVTNPAIAKDGSKGVVREAMSADVLTAHFARVDGTDHIAEVHGDGHAALKKVNVKGVVNNSSADSLVAKFRPVTAGAAKTAGPAMQGRDEIVEAVEQGRVVVTQIPVRKPGETVAPHEERAVAERAVYSGALERMTLTGNVQVDDGTSVLWADRLVMEQPTGDATADASVKASYRQSGKSDEPVHVLASRVEMKHDTEVATFYGMTGRPARMWQAGSQVEAPVIQFDRKQKRLLARGAGEGAPMAVHTTLVSARKAEKHGTGESGGVVKAGGGKTEVVRITSRELAYSDEARRADFTGGVQVESVDGSMRGQQAAVYLQAAPNEAGGTGASGVKASPGGDAGGFIGGSIDRMVASGHVEMEQPGRHATGEQLVYTASDGMYVLTGTPGELPKVADQQQGTVTGTSLSFHAGDENVVVSNGGDGGPRVRTETRVKNKR